MPDDALQTVMLRNHFYRDNYRRVTMVLLIAMLVIVGQLVSTYYLMTHRPQPQYFATDAEGRITRLHPLSQPVVSASALLAWATQAAVQAYTFNFVDYRRQLQRASTYFTSDGWKAYESALTASRNLETVIGKKLVATAVPTGAPRIVNRGVIMGRYAWTVTLPVLVKYQSANTNYSQPLMIRMIITRVPVLNDPKGIAIAQFVAGPMSTQTV